MALTPFPVFGLPAAYGSAGVALTWTAGDVVNHNSFPSSGREILIVHNTNGTSTAHSHTIKSVPDVPENRTGDIVESIPAGAYKTYQEFPSGGWANGGNIEVDPSDAELVYIVLRVP